MRYMKLNLKGFMQHYSSGKHVVTAPSSVYYKTEKVPTRSAVLGMIGAALGVSREDRGRLERLNNVLDIKYDIQKKGTVLVDYQTARPLNNDERFVAVSGKTKEDGVRKKVEYLCGYEFFVFIGGEDKLLDEIREAFECPVYPPFLGKRNCVPSKMVFEEGFVEIGELPNVYDCP